MTAVVHADRTRSGFFTASTARLRPALLARRKRLISRRREHAGSHGRLGRGDPQEPEAIDYR